MVQILYIIGVIITHGVWPQCCGSVGPEGLDGSRPGLKSNDAFLVVRVAKVSVQTAGSWSQTQRVHMAVSVNLGFLLKGSL